MRERAVILTELGLEKVTEAFPLWEKAQAQVKKRLGQKGLDTLFTGLSALVPLTSKR